PPEKPEECRESTGRHGEVSFHYDRRPQVLHLTIEPPAGPRQTQEVALGELDSIEVVHHEPACEAPRRVSDDPVVLRDAPDCGEALRVLKHRAQNTRVPASAEGHQVDAAVSTLATGGLGRVRHAGGDAAAFAALKDALGRGGGSLPGPCSD